LSNLRTTAQENVLEKLEGLADVQKGFQCSKIEYYRLVLKKYKLIYKTLGMFSESSSLLIGSFWAAKIDQDKIVNTVDHLKQDDPMFISANIYPMMHDKVPPSLFRTNDFTQPFQTIVETFSIPKYKEINPALVTTVTFPFLFGLMFGDVAHGSALFLIAWWVARSDLYKTKQGRVIFKLRYILLLMGFFSVYCGFIYNDFMGIKMFNGKSCYVEEVTVDNNGKSKDIYVRRPNCVYPVGFDSVWGNAKNEISFENSFKMKFSIIIGFLQMSLGIIFKGWNNLYFGNYVEFIFEFIPQILFMSSIFGYMCFCIIVKWLTDWTNRDPPSIINIFTSLTSLVGQFNLAKRTPASDCSKTAEGSDGYHNNCCDLLSGDASCQTFNSSLRRQEETLACSQNG